MAPAVLNCCLAVVRWTPVLFITAVVVWSYYAYVIEMCFFTVESIPEKILYLVLFHPVLFMFSWAYWQVIFTKPGSPPKEFLLPVNELEAYNNAETEDQQREVLHRVAKNLPVQCRTVTGGIRFCEKCKSIKPDRAHHCSVCGQCILKMDHHCPWVNNCVCFTNYKYFILFLGYALVYCLYVAATSLQYFIKFWTTVSSGKGMTSFHILFLFFIAIMFAISLTSLFAYHIFLTTSNRSTLESFRAPIFRTGPDKDGFSLGKYANFQEVFGDSKATWFLPIYTSLGDGVTYPTRVVQQPNSASYNSMDNTVPSPVHTPPESELSPSHLHVAPDLAPETTPQPASFGDGMTYPTRSVDEDHDSLLGQRQRWMEEGEADGEGLDNPASKR